MAQKTERAQNTGRFAGFTASAQPPKNANQGIFLVCIAFLAIFGVFISSFYISGAMKDEREELLFSLHGRAESVVWAIEGGARFIGAQAGNISQMIEEIGRQPGIAWIALVNSQGKIIFDSNSQIEGSLLYTPGELAALNATAQIKGRFSPDDPSIYETWKLFRPGRLRMRMHHMRPQAPVGPLLIFVALDATDFNKNLDEYRNGLIFDACLVIMALLAGIALIFYIYSYRQSRRRLQDTEAFAEQVLQSYPAALIVADDRNRIMFFNDLALKIFGLDSPPATLGDIPSMDWDGIRHEMASGETVCDQEKNLLLANGAQLPVSLSAGPVCDSSGHILGYLFSLRDLGEIRQLRENLDRSRKLSAIGKLASGLAHEIRNPLSSICGYAHYLEQKFDANCMEKEIARLLGEETRRINAVLTDLLSLARPPAPDLRMQNLLPLVRKSYLVASPDAEAKGVSIDLELPPESGPEIAIDADRLIQALLNLLINAIQATPPGGVIKMSASYSPASREGKTDAHWKITVRDNGPGIPDKLLKQIFTPYFTTRAEGTGLGLAIAQQIVESHRGSLLAASAPGQGATFTMILPVTGGE